MADETWMMAQQSVLGAFLIDEKAVGAVILSLEESDFQNVNRSIFREIRERYLTGKPVDPVSVLGSLDGGNEYRDYLVQLMQITPTAANVKSYAEVCRERSRVNRYHEIGQSLLEVSTSRDGAEIIRNSNHVNVGRGMECWTMAEALSNFFDRYHRKVEYLPWFLSQLNGKLDMEFGDFCLLGGRPSSGKSAFALEAVLYWGVKCGYRVGFYSYETSREKLTNRMLAASAGVRLDDIKHSRLSEKEIDALCDISSRISEAPIDIISASGKTVSEIQSFAMMRRHQIVVVDYLQIIADSGKDEYSQVSNISKQLHTMCQSLGIFCLALCQLNRTKGSRPTLEDLRSSGQLEQDADSVLFLHKQEIKDNEREFIIAKNKEGECGSTKLHFDGPTQHFSYIGKGDKPIKGVDYGSLRAVAQSDDGGYEQMPMDTDVPFDSNVPSAC